MGELRKVSCKLCSVAKMKRKNKKRTSLVVQWLKSACQCRGQGFNPWSRKDSTHCGATKPVPHNYWSGHAQESCAAPTELVHPEPTLQNKRDHCSERPRHCDYRAASLDTTKESPCSSRDLVQPKINNKQKIGKALSLGKYAHDLSKDDLSVN